MAKDRILQPFLSITRDKFTVDAIEDLKRRIDFKVGDVVELNGYYVAGDGAGHKRKVKNTDDGSGVQLANGLWANIVHNGEVNVSWFGWKTDGTINYITKPLPFDGCKYIFDKATYKFDFNGLQGYFRCFYSREGNIEFEGNGAELILVNGIETSEYKSSSMFAISIPVFCKIKGFKLTFDRTTETGNFGEYGHAIGLWNATHGGEAEPVSKWGERVIVEDIVGVDWHGDTLDIGGVYDCTANNIRSYRAGRNGISVRGVKNLNADYWYSEGTKGTAPEAGVDIECDIDCNFSQNINIGSIVTKSNKFCGLLFTDVVDNVKVNINNVKTESETSFITYGTYGKNGSSFYINNLMAIDTKLYTIRNVESSSAFVNNVYSEQNTGESFIYYETRDKKTNPYINLGRLELIASGLTTTAIAFENNLPDVFLNIGLESLNINSYSYIKTMSDNVKFDINTLKNKGFANGSTHNINQFSRFNTGNVVGVTLENYSDNYPREFFFDSLYLKGTTTRKRILYRGVETTGTDFVADCPCTITQFKDVIYVETKVKAALIALY